MAALETGLFLLALTVFLFIVSRVMPRIERQRAMKASHDAFISHFGIIYEGVVYPFRSFLVWQTGIHVRKASKEETNGDYFFISASWLVVLLSSHSM